MQLRRWTSTGFRLSAECPAWTRWRRHLRHRTAKRGRVAPDVTCCTRLPLFVHTYLYPPRDTRSGRDNRTAYRVDNAPSCSGRRGVTVCGTQASCARPTEEACSYDSVARAALG